MPLEPAKLLRYFSPDRYLIKITPLNPTHSASKNGLNSFVNLQDTDSVGLAEVVHPLEQAGYQVIISIGELEENAIGSNCGQYVLRHMRSLELLQDAYSYDLQDFAV
jgi:23S rRNA (adenine2503-C2)-methyltransferase